MSDSIGQNRVSDLSGQTQKWRLLGILLDPIIMLLNPGPDDCVRQCAYNSKTSSVGVTSSIPLSSRRSGRGNGPGSKSGNGPGSWPSARMVPMTVLRCSVEKSYSCEVG